MKLLVVTATLGESRWLAETAASVPSDAAHVLVCPAAKLEELRARFPRATVVCEPGGGMYAAIDAGLAAVGEWDAFTYLNDDDLLLPAFRKVLKATERARGAHIVYGGVRLIDANGRRLGAIPISRSPTLNRALYAQRLEPVFQHGTVVSRDAFEELGGFDSSFRLCGDSEFLARACLKGVPFICATGQAVAAFRVRAGQQTKNRAAMNDERRRVDEKLGLLATTTTARHRWARACFRFANVAIYAERIVRHGFVTFDDVLTRGRP